MKFLQHSVLWDTYLQSIKTVLSENNLNAAQRLLSYALSDAESFRELDDRLEWCTYGVASDFCAEGNYKAADALYKRLVETKERILGTGLHNVEGFCKLAPELMRSETKTHFSLTDCHKQVAGESAKKSISCAINETTKFFVSFFERISGGF